MCFRRQYFRYPSSQFPPPQKLAVFLITANSTTCHTFLSRPRCHTSFHYCNQHAHYTYCSIHRPTGSRKVLHEKTVQQRHRANLLHALSSQRKFNHRLWSSGTRHRTVCYMVLTVFRRCLLSLASSVAQSVQ
jgi:hypothetical protein